MRVRIAYSLNLLGNGLLGRCGLITATRVCVGRLGDTGRPPTALERVPRLLAHLGGPTEASGTLDRSVKHV